MKPTLDQLNALSDYEINCAVAEKLGYEIQKSERLDSKFISVYELSNDGERKVWAAHISFVDMAKYYMEIAVGRCIDIGFTTDRNQVWCSWVDDSAIDETHCYPKDQTGRAVCIAFLLMNQEPV